VAVVTHTRGLIKTRFDGCVDFDDANLSRLLQIDRIINHADIPVRSLNIHKYILFERKNQMQNTIKRELKLSNCGI
jgi:hypothetical protein